MNSRSLRRLAKDHSSLHDGSLPPNFLFDPKVEPSSDLTQLDILLAGPTSTPYETGVFKLHLAIPPTYPNDPPKAFFRTKIFHPNVDDATGAVCVETLKRDWDNKLSLRDVLVTISCLLIQPNASSALNADAGMLLEQTDGGWEAFEKRAKLMTRLHASIPKRLQDLVQQAQARGNDAETTDGERGMGRRKRNARPTTDVTATFETQVASQESVRTPPPPPVKSATTTRPFVLHSAMDDVFSARLPPPGFNGPRTEVRHTEQERGIFSSPVTAQSTLQLSPTLQEGSSHPRNEVSITETVSDDSLESEYPPSPKKGPRREHNQHDGYPSSPKKSPRKPQLTFDPENMIRRPEFERGESSRSGAERKLLFTPIPLPAYQSEDTTATSALGARQPAKQRRSLAAQRRATLEKTSVRKPPARPAPVAGVTRPRPIPEISAEQRRNDKLEAKLWRLCGGDVDRWNRGDFGNVFHVKAARW